MGDQTCPATLSCWRFLTLSTYIVMSFQPSQILTATEAITVGLFDPISDAGEPLATWGIFPTTEKTVRALQKQIEHYHNDPRSRLVLAIIPAD